MSYWFLRKPPDGSEELIGDGTEDGQESAWLEPGSVLRRVEPHLHEFTGTRPEKPDLEQAGRVVQGHGGSSSYPTDTGLCWRQHAEGRSAIGASPARTARDHQRTQ